MSYLKTFMIQRALIFFLGIVLFASCKGDDYYVDGGKANPKFGGTIMQYLESKPVEFDSVVQILKLSGLDKVLAEEEVTFFAPRDQEIKQLIGRLDQGGLNLSLYVANRDTIKVLADVDSLIWRKYLLRHVFKGKSKLQDYPQIDFGQLLTFPGENYYSYNNSVANIGVVYNDAEGVRYMGYRQLHISYIPDLSRPFDGWRTSRVASSDLEPDNGIVHVLDVNTSELGFNLGEMMTEIFDSKR